MEKGIQPPMAQGRSTKTLVNKELSLYLWPWNAAGWSRGGRERRYKRCHTLHPKHVLSLPPTTTARSRRQVLLAGNVMRACADDPDKTDFTAVGGWVREREREARERGEIEIGRERQEARLAPRAPQSGDTVGCIGGRD